MAKATEKKKAVKKKAAKKTAGKPAKKAPAKSKQKKVVALFPEAAFGPALNSVCIVHALEKLGHNVVFLSDPGFLDVVANKSPDVVRIYLPPDVNCLLSTADHCLRSRNYVNVIVSDKQLHHQYLTPAQAITHCTKGIGIWDWACTDDGVEPDVVLASAGDIPTAEALAAILEVPGRIAVCPAMRRQCDRARVAVVPRRNPGIRTQTEGRVARPHHHALPQ